MSRQHVCDKRPGYKDGDSRWVLGGVDSCPYHGKRQPLGIGPMFNIARLQDQNRGNYTERGFAREIEDAARADGREIERAS